MFNVNLTKGDAQHISSAEVDSSVAAAGATLIHFTDRLYTPDPTLSDVRYSRGSVPRLFFTVFWTLFAGTCVIDAGDVACSPGRTPANSIKGGLRSRHFNDTGVEVLSCGSFNGRRASLPRAPKTRLDGTHLVQLQGYQ